jgi:hypothetical protein
MGHGPLDKLKKLMALSIGPLGKIYFWPLSRSFRPLDLLHYFYRKKQVYAISHSPELPSFFDPELPVRLITPSAPS